MMKHNAEKRFKLVDRPQSIKAKRGWIFYSIAICIGLVLESSGAMAKVTVQLRPTQVKYNEPLQLILTSNNANASELPDLSPLQKDFAILGTESNVSYSVVNGTAASYSQWIIVLRPKKTGDLLIPALTVGQDHTEALHVQVGRTSTSEVKHDTTAAEEVMLKAKVDAQKPFLNQQVLYTVELYNHGRLMNPVYVEPKIQNGLLLPLGQGRHYQTEVNHESYEVEEQRYAIFPQKTGPLTITAPTLEAQVYAEFPNPIHVKAEDIVLNVQEKPGDAHLPWLPAKEVILSEQKEDRYKQGDTWTRTVTLSVTDQPAQLLPTLVFDKGSAFDVYPETPVVNNQLKGGELIGKAKIKATYVFNQSGKIVIPAMSVPWFNTVTKTNEIASLPEKILTVELKTQTPPTERPSASIPHVGSSASPKQTVSLWIFAAGFGLAFGLMALVWWVKWVCGRRKTVTHSLRQLKKACAKNQAVQARKALFNFAKAEWPNVAVLNLEDIARMMNDTKLKQAFHLLKEALYDKQKEASWQGQAFWASFCAYRAKKVKRVTQKKGVLPSIHPKR